MGATRTYLKLEADSATRGFQAWTVISLDEVKKILASWPDVLPILCYSLSAEECEQALAFLHLLKPARKSLVLTAGMPTCGSGEDDELLSAFDGPRALVASVGRLLKASGVPEKPSDRVIPSSGQVQTTH